MVNYIKVKVQCWDMEPISQYSRNREKYDRINKKLDKVNQKFMDAGKEKSRRMILDSYIFAVFSVQTPVSIHEDAFKQYKNGAELEDATESVNHRRNKVEYIRETEVKFEEIDEAIRLLKNGDVDRAHRQVADHFKGVGTIKAAFTLAMLGFKTRACIDTNVLTALDMDRDEMYDGVVIDRYKEFVDESFKSIDDRLLKELPNRFTAQWVVFDAVRGKFTSHDVFFDYVGETI